MTTRSHFDVSNPALIKASLFAIVLLTLISSAAKASDSDTFLNAQNSDPVKMGWMVGSPPPRDRIVGVEDGSFLEFPQLRWTFSHWRELRPTVRVSRGTGPIAVLPRAEREDLDAVSFLPHGASEKMTWERSLDANYTDGIVVLHKGAIVYEKYFGALQPDGLHMAFSVTKSFIGTIVAMLIAENAINPDFTVTQYIPELENTAYGDATIAQVLDMKVSLKFDETYGDRKSDIWRYSIASGVRPRPTDYSGPRTNYEFLQSVSKNGAHGRQFSYQSTNTAVLAWVISRVTGQRIEQVLSDRIWKPMGMESDAYMGVDAIGTAWTSGGLNLQLRDLARFGEMMRSNGKFNDKQIVPESFVSRIRQCGLPDGCPETRNGEPKGRRYYNQWWVMRNDHRAFAARGVYGQTVYIDPKAEMVIARLASYPQPGNTKSDASSLPAFQALAEHLMNKAP